jgi:hypothetical protein
MAEKKRRQAIITVDVETRKVTVTDENGKPGKRLTSAQGRALYESGLIDVATVLQSDTGGKTCIVIRVDGTEIVICL